MERLLGGGERHEHRLAVEAGWYVRLEIEQVGVDVAVSLLGPDGAALFSTDDPDGIQDKEIVAVIAPVAGELVLAVTARDPAAAPGAYRVNVTARRPAGPGDVERAAAQKSVAEAWHLVDSQEADQRREAIVLLQEAARLLGEAGETRAEIDAINELGILQNMLLDPQSAISSFQRALSRSLEVGDLEGEAFARSNLAGVAGTLTNAQRLEHYSQALTLFEKTGNRREQGRVLYGIGLLQRDRGDLDAALRYLSDALRLRQDTGDLRGKLVTLLALAWVHQARGEIEEASARAREALELSRLPEGEGREASVLQVLASLQRYGGELGEAVKSLREARSLYQRAGDGQLEARALYNLATLYQDLGDLEEALRSYEQALELFGGKNPDVEVRILNGIGRIRHLQGDPQAAISYHEKALALARERDIPSGVAEALGFSGVAYIDQGRVREGLQLLEDALALRRVRRERSAEAGTLLETARAWQLLGDLDRAAALFGETLALGRQVGNTGLEATCLYHWAVLDRQRGDLRQALMRVEEALQMIESVRSGVGSEKLRVTYLASKRAWYELYIDLLMRLDEAEPGRGYAVMALEASERARARGLLDLIAEGRIDVEEGIAPALKRQEKELGARLSWIQESLDEAMARDPEGARAAELRAQLDQVGGELQQLEDEIRRLHPRYAEVRYPTPLRLDQIRNLLDQRTALLEYFVGQESSFLFFVTRDGLSTYRLPRAAELDPKVQDLRETLERPGPLTRMRFLLEAGELYKLLLGPVAERLARTPDLLISPDGALSFVPFEVLVADPGRGSSYRDLAYLLEEHAITYVPSASVLDGLRELRASPAAEAPPRKDLIAFGNPILPGTQVAAAPVRGSLTPWTASPLPGSELEVKAIASLYAENDVALYLGEAATEENVKANPLLNTAHRVHFATHGFVDEVHPQFSWLMLTRTPGSEEDGRLQVREIFNLRLEADLVTLSACQTGLGKQMTGEGMVGLTRAFLYAGARSLLVSLWPVSDRSTPELMTGFYRHLGASGTKAEALRQAKLERIKAGDEPYRWAPFILAGDSR